jgi:hypothetical protein
MLAVRRLHEDASRAIYVESMLSLPERPSMTAIIKQPAEHMPDMPSARCLLQG